MTRIVAPMVPPVSLDQLQRHLRIEPGDDDAYAQDCLDAAVAQFDGADGELGRALVSQTWRETFEAIPGVGLPVYLFLSPVTELLSIEVAGPTGTWESRDVADYEVNDDGIGVVRVMGPWPRTGRSSMPLRIAYVAGYGPMARDVPKPIVHAILLFAAHLYKIREPVVMDGNPVEVPMSISRLVANHKVWWR